MLADVCADHALLALAAVEQGMARRALAIDVAFDPLRRAARTLADSEDRERVALLQGDGLAAVRRCDAVAIAGVGGDLAAALLAASGDCAGASRLVVQPNRHADAVRSWARQTGFHLAAERVIPEAGRLHVLLTFQREAGMDPAYGAHPLEAELILGPLLLRSTDSAALQLLRQEQARLSGLASRRPDLAVASAVLDRLLG